jgi:hypothetical protein
VEGPQADEAAAKVLGLSVDDLRTALRSGSTLAQLAKKQGKDVDSLVNALVTVAKDRLAEGVKAGWMTQDRAAQIEKTLEQRVRSVVQNGRPGPGFKADRPWRDHGWPGQKGHDQEREGTTPSPNGSAKPTPSESAKTSSSSFNHA